MSNTCKQGMQALPSSMTRIFDRRRRARAMQINCRCPTLKFSPYSSTVASSVFGRLCTNDSSCVCSSTCSSASSLCSLKGSDVRNQLTGKQQHGTVHISLPQRYAHNRKPANTRTLSRIDSNNSNNNNQPTTTSTTKTTNDAITNNRRRYNKQHGKLTNNQTNGIYNNNVHQHQ